MARRTGWLLDRSFAFADAPTTALAFLKFEQGLQKSRAVEVGPERLGDENLRIRNLPEQEIADAHFAAGADQQVGVRQALGIQVPGQLFLADALCGSMAVAFLENCIHGVDDLGTAAIVQSQTLHHALIPPCLPHPFPPTL